MKLTQLALLVIFALVSSCSILPKAEPSDVYRLPSAQTPQRSLTARRNTGRYAWPSHRPARR